MEGDRASDIKTFCKFAAASWKECSDLFKSSTRAVDNKKTNTEKDPSYQPPMEVIKFDDRYEVRLDVPRKINYQYDNIKVRQENGNELVISRTRNLDESMGVPEDATYLTKELDKVMLFEARVELDSDANFNAVETDHNNYGELTVTIKRFPPRGEANTPKILAEIY